MPLPSFVQASAGAWMTGSSQVETLSGVTVGNLIVFHVLNDGTAGSTSVSALSGVEALDGTDNAMTYFVLSQVGSPQSGSQEFWVGRAILTSVSITFNTDNATDAGLRIYEFRDVIGGTTLAAIFENAAATSANGFGTSATVADRLVTTNGENRLALNFVATDATSTLASFTGETGGDWTEAVAEYAPGLGTLGSLQLQTAPMPAAGTLDGGTQTITSAGWGAMGTALIGLGTHGSYSSEVLADSPAGYWKMNETAGLVRDSSPNANHATSSGGTLAYSEAGPIQSDPSSKSIKFTDPGAGESFFDIPDHATLDFGNAFTYEIWIRRNRPGTAEEENFFTKQSSAGMFIGPSSFHSDEVYCGRPGVGVDRYSTPRLTNAAIWHHVVYIRNGAGATGKVYVDGLDVTGADDGNYPIDSASALRIGGDGLTHTFDGWISHAAVYPTALSEARVRAHFAAAQGAVIANPSFASHPRRKPFGRPTRKAVA